MATIRTMNPGDLDDIGLIFHQSVRGIACQNYTDTELTAWSPKVRNAEHWQKRMDGLKVWVAVSDGVLCGFIGITAAGYLDLLFVLPSHARQGIASALVEKTETFWKAHQIGLIWVEASLTARPFFESVGYHVVKEQTVECRGIWIRNFRMEKKLEL